MSYTDITDDSDTDSDPNRVPAPERSVDDDTRRFYHNAGHMAVRGVRQATLKRLIVLDTVLQYDYRTQGAVYERWSKRKRDPISDTQMNFMAGVTPDDFDALAESAREIEHESDVAFLTDVSERTAWDYLKALRHFYT